MSRYSPKNLFAARDIYHERLCRLAHGVHGDTGNCRTPLRTLHCLTQLQLVVTQPDRPAGRGKLRAPPVKNAAEELGVKVWQPESLRHDSGDFLAEIDLVIVLAYGELLREPILNAPRLGCINLHASLLPRWRGASPLQSVINAGDAETGVTVMRWCGP